MSAPLPSLPQLLRQQSRYLRAVLREIRDGVRQDVTVEGDLTLSQAIYEEIEYRNAGRGW